MTEARFSASASPENGMWLPGTTFCGSAMKASSFVSSHVTELALNVNGRDLIADVDDPKMPLLYFLRNELGLRGPRFGCGLGRCGACMVDIDGVAVRSCIIEEQVVQCEYCINGMIMQAIAFLKQTPKPSEEQVRGALRRNLCRCGTHLRIVRAVLRAANG